MLHISENLPWTASCLAHGKKCNNCVRMNHFASMCRTKQVNTVARQSDNAMLGPNDTYTFTIGNVQSGKVTLSIRSIPLTVLVDSGTDINVMNKNTWSKLKRQTIKCISIKAGPTKSLFACGCPKPLTMLGTFMTETKTSNNKCNAKFFVIDNVGISLLVLETATQLQLLKIRNIATF